MKRYNMRDVTPYVTVHPDGDWVRYEDHVEAMKRIAGDSAQQAEKTVAAIDSALRGKVNDPDPLPKLHAHSVAGEPTTYGLVAALLRERDALLAKVAKFDQRIVDLGVLAMETAVPAPSASAQQAEPVAFNERASVWKVQNPETGYVWFTEAREQALREARDGKTVTGFGSAIAAPAPASPAAPAEDEPPQFWWINHGSHGQVTMRADEAEKAAKAGAKVYRYGSASPADQGEDARDAALSALVTAESELRDLDFEHPSRKEIRAAIAALKGGA